MIGVRKWSTQFLPWLSFGPSPYTIRASNWNSSDITDNYLRSGRTQRHVIVYSQWGPRHSRPQPPVLEVPLLDRINFGELFSTSLRSSPFFFLTRIHHCISACIAITAHRKLSSGRFKRPGRLPGTILYNLVYNASPFRL